MALQLDFFWAKIEIRNLRHYLNYPSKSHITDAKRRAKPRGFIVNFTKKKLKKQNTSVISKLLINKYYGRSAFVLRICQIMHK